MQEKYPYEPYPWEQQAKKSPYADSPYANKLPYEEPRYTPPVYQPPKKKSGAGKVILCVLLALVLVAGSSLATALVLNQVWEEKLQMQNAAMENRLDVIQSQVDQGGSGSTGATMPTGAAMTPGQVYAENVDAVVAVNCQVVQQNQYGQTSSYESFGSGFIISEDGYVVSNYHVVQGATQIMIQLDSGREYEAQLVGYEATNDVALLKVDGQELPHVQIGSSDALAVGDQVVAIGNPLGELTSTLTVGYVSAKDRVVTTDGSTISMFQTDAAINSGNSGGPLFNAYGQVVGITTAKYSGTSTSGASIEGIGFAIPMDDVMGILEDLKEFGYVKGAYLGVYVRDVSQDAQSYGMPAGSFVEEVTKDSCAAAAKLKAGDIIIDLGGYAITSTSDLTRMLRKFNPGESTTITVWRNGNEVVLQVTFDEKPAEQPVQETIPEQGSTQPTIPWDGSTQDPYEDFFGGYGWPWSFFDEYFG